MANGDGLRIKKASFMAMSLKQQNLILFENSEELKASFPKVSRDARDAKLVSGGMVALFLAVLAKLIGFFK
jgi:hypothetical protein